MFTDQQVAGVMVPGTRLARDFTTELVHHHSRRVYWFGSRHGHNRALGFDPGYRRANFLNFIEDSAWPE